MAGSSMGSDEGAAEEMTCDGSTGGGKKRSANRCGLCAGEAGSGEAAGEGEEDGDEAVEKTDPAEAGGKAEGGAEGEDGEEEDVGGDVGDDDGDGDEDSDDGAIANVNGYAACTIASDTALETADSWVVVVGGGVGK